MSIIHLTQENYDETMQAGLPRSEERRVGKEC